MYLDMASMFFWWKGINLLNRPSVVSAYQKKENLISQPNHNMWVLKRAVSEMVPFSTHIYAKIDGY